MSPERNQDWSPGTYSRFRGFRLRPGLDLLAQVPEPLPAGDIIDLGCGAGALAEPLAHRYPKRRRIGVDLSPAMLNKARDTECYQQLIETDIAHWSPQAPPALIYSNAALHWLPDHDKLLTHLAQCLAPGGVLAIQVPNQQTALSHQLLRHVSQALFPELFDWSDWRDNLLPPAEIETLLSPYGVPLLWQTVYYQRLAGAGPETGHPVRRFTESTAARPVLTRLNDGQKTEFLEAYDTALADAYPLRGDGSALLPFQRLFILLET